MARTKSVARKSFKTKPAPKSVVKARKQSDDEEKDEAWVEKFKKEYEARYKQKVGSPRTPEKIKTPVEKKVDVFKKRVEKLKKEYEAKEKRKSPRSLEETYPKPPAKRRVPPSPLKGTKMSPMTKTEKKAALAMMKEMAKPGHKPKGKIVKHASPEIGVPSSPVKVKIVKKKVVKSPASPEEIFKRGEGNTKQPLMYAALTGDLSTVRKLLPKSKKNEIMKAYLAVAENGSSGVRKELEGNKYVIGYNAERMSPSKKKVKLPKGATKVGTPQHVLKPIPNVHAGKIELPENIKDLTKSQFKEILKDKPLPKAKVTAKAKVTTKKTISAKAKVVKAKSPVKKITKKKEEMVVVKPKSPVKTTKKKEEKMVRVKGTMVWAKK